VSDRRTVTSSTYANPDGTLTLEQSAGPRWAARPDGSFAPIDPSLQRVNGKLHPAAVDIDASFSGDGSGDAATVQAGGGTAAIGSPAPATAAPTVRGNDAAYQLADGTQMHLTALPDSVEQAIVLPTRPAAPPTYRIPLNLKHLAARQNADGTIDLLNSAKNGSAGAHDERRHEAGSGTRSCCVPRRLSSTTRRCSIR
jgi:hypothetical protein